MTFHFDYGYKIFGCLIMNKKLWVLWFEYFDSSGCEVVRIYDDENRAKEDFELVEGDAKKWKLSQVPFFSTPVQYDDEAAF